MYDWGIGFNSRQGNGFFSSPEPPKQIWGSPSLLPSGTGGSFPGDREMGDEADHSHRPSADVKNTRSYSSTPPYKQKRTNSPELYGAICTFPNLFNICQLWALCACNLHDTSSPEIYPCDKWPTVSSVLEQKHPTL
jgi:hypothetical protein